MHSAILLIGGNMGNRSLALQRAIRLIGQRVGRIEKRSSVYETAAWGKEDEEAFYNQVLFVQTPLPVEDLMHHILQIEEEMGRIRTVKNAARIIDIDILFYEDLILGTEFLTIPHPQIENRRFVLAPLVEIAPDLIHPKLKKSVEKLLQETGDKLAVRKLAAAASRTE